MNEKTTFRNWTLLLVRFALAAVIFPHGAQKVLGWFGGYGFSGTYEAFTTKMHIPAPLAVAAIAAEFLGALGVAFGFLTRWSAAGVGVTMLVAAVMNLKNGFFMNWFGNQKGEGIEFFIPVVAVALFIIVEGAGAFSLDAVLKGLRKPKVSSAVTA